MAEVRLGWDNDRLRAGAAGAAAIAQRTGAAMRRGLSGIGGSIAGELKGALPAMSVLALGAAIKGTITEMDDLADASARLGESAEDIQRVEFAAKNLASLDIQQLTTPLEKLEKALGDIENAGAAESLESLGISAGELSRMPLPEKMLALADAYQKAKASGQVHNDLMQLMGKSAGELIPMLEAGREGIRELYDEAGTVSEANVFRMAALNDQLDGYIAKTKAWVTEMIGNGLAAAKIWGGILSGKSSDQIASEMAMEEIEMIKRIQSMQETRDRKAQEREKAAAAARQKDLDEKAKKAQDIADKQADALALYDQETEILRAQARGQDDKARALQRNKEIAEETLKIMKEMGLSEEAALEKARERANLKDQAEENKKKEKRIKGYSRDEQGNADDAAGRANRRNEDSRERAEKSRKSGLDEMHERNGRNWRLDHESGFRDLGPDRTWKRDKKDSLPKPKASEGKTPTETDAVPGLLKNLIDAVNALGAN